MICCCTGRAVGPTTDRRGAGSSVAAPTGRGAAKSRFVEEAGVVEPTKSAWATRYGA